MKAKDPEYRALVSSDWNECLAPSGPFDFVTFTHPSFGPAVKEIFKAYTGNHIPLSEAARRISGLLPRMITEEQMDVYLDERFATYRGVPELIEWCGKEKILFMINTTGMQGYFQRIFKKALLPDLPVVSAHPMVRYRAQGETTRRWYDLLEIEDKPKHTRAVMRAFGIPPEKVVLIGDSGGDGPHFEWGAKAGAFIIGSMTKGSLERYCGERGIQIDLYFGPRHAKREKRIKAPEMEIDFVNLIPGIEAVL